MSELKVETLSPGSELDATGGAALESSDYLFHLFAVASRHREARLDALMKPLGLSLSRHRALSVIVGLAPCTMSELADFTAMDRTTLTRIVDQLVEGALVERATSREDRRQVLLTVTDAGREVCRKSLWAISEINRTLVTDMTAEEQRMAVKLLERLVTNLVEPADLRQRLLLRDDRTAHWGRGRSPPLRD